MFDDELPWLSGWLIEVVLGWLVVAWQDFVRVHQYESPKRIYQLASIALVVRQAGRQSSRNE